MSSDCVYRREHRDLQSTVLVHQYYTTCYFFPLQGCLPIGFSITSAVYPVIDLQMNGNVSIYVMPLGKPYRIVKKLNDDKEPARLTVPAISLRKYASLPNDWCE
jgi:hypothetical protein